jgi:hypothetical protein
MTSTKRLRSAITFINIALDHIDRAHEGTEDQRQGRREQVASAIGEAAKAIADAGAHFAIETFRRGAA